MAYRIHQIYEELVQQILLPVLPSPKIRVTVEYSDAEASTVFNVLYNGESFDVTQKGDALSLAILKSAAAEMSWTAGTGEFPNNVTLRIADRDKNDR